jgi:YD repeat-containing protein
MHYRRALPLVAAAVPLVMATSPADAAPPVGKGRPGGETYITGTLHSIDTKKRTLVLDDGTRVRYDSNDALIAQHMRDALLDFDDDGVAETLTCDFRDFGSEATIAAFVRRGITPEVEGTVYSARKDVSYILVVADTCNGVLDAADADAP